MGPDKSRVLLGWNRGSAVIASALGALCLGTAAFAAPGDTTWVQTFQDDFYNWATPHYDTFPFPEDPAFYQKVVVFYTIGCPSFPADCDPWDRLGHLRVVTEDGDVEIARIITPYDITGTGRPGTCTWIINVTSYKSILHGAVTLRNYIESWIGGNNGWLVTIDFAFIEGERAMEPYKVVNLWQNDHVIYGDPSQPVTEAIQPIVVDIDEGVDDVRVRVFATGHGQGNTLNCAEFCAMDHSLVVNGSTFTHMLWNFGCGSNPCSPQGGNWTPGRAGWCPGMEADAWGVDITGAVTPGQSATLEYRIENYENLCRPNNPNCVSGVTCADCNYNSTGHTEPHYTIQAQVIFSKNRAEVVSVDERPPARVEGVSLAQSTPNPSSSETTIAYSIEEAGPVKLTIFDAAGRLVRELRRGHPAPGDYSYQWNLRDSDGRRVASGTYFYQIETTHATQARKLVVVK
jgi:hypothetical protein